MERYSSYKPTSMQWLKEIPSHWEVRILGSFAKLKTGGTPSFYLKEVEEDSVDWFTPSDFTESFDLKEASRKLNKRDFEEAGIAYFPPNSILIIGIGGTAGKVSYNSIPCYSNQQITAIIPYRDMNCVFCTMYIRSLRDFLLKTAPYTTLPILNNTFLSSIKVVLPPLAEQEKIVSYLEDKTSKIDAYVADKEKEIELLQELKQKTIADAVTKGLNPDAKMKDSGISWIGEIPEHWEVKRIASLFTGKVQANTDFKYHHAFKFYYGTLVPKNEVGDVEEYRDTYVKYSVLQKDDIMINGLNLNYDFVSQRVAIAPSDGIITSAYVVARPRKGTNALYYNYLFKTMDNMKLFHGMGTGIRLTLSFDEMKKQLVVVPPQDEQQAIVTYIEEKCEKIDKLASELQSEIDYLKEYKQRLIADCVTGQVNVQNEMI